MKTPPPRLLRKAAALLETHARSLWRGHTIGPGQWDATRPAAKTRYHELRATARDLRLAA